MTRARRLVGAAPLMATLTALLAGEAVLWFSGRALPPLTADRVGLARAIEDADPLALAMSVLRLVALVAGAAMLGVILIGLVARALGADGLAGHLDRLTPATLRRLLDGALGLGLAAGIGLSSLPAGATPIGGAASTLRRLPDAPPGTGPITTLRRLPDAVPTPVPLAVSPPPPSPMPAQVDPGDAPSPQPGAVPAPAPVRASTEPAEVVVRPGDSFWRLSERRERQRLGRRPTEAEVGACWQAMVALNRHRLVVADNPDLLFPGQVLQLPSV